MNATEIDLQIFCESSDREKYNRPHVRSGVKYATDGKMLVAVPCDDPDSSVKNNTISAESLLSKHRAETTAAWPTEFADAEIDCRTCDGSGAEKQVKCEDCDGEGTKICPTCDHEDECNNCDGHGTIPEGICPDCHGKKKRLQPSHQYVGVAKIDWKIGHRVLTLPNVRYAEPKKDAPVYFTFDGGEGLAMPLKTCS